MQCLPPSPVAPGVVSCPWSSSAELFAATQRGAGETEIFAIGDIHGRSDLIGALIDEAAREPKLVETRVIVLLGDLVDRGPDSLGAIDLAIGAKARVDADEAIALMGNHEAMMRLALDPETPSEEALDAFDTWIADGGDRTLAEFAPGGSVAART